MSKIRRIMRDLLTAICMVVIASMIISKILTGWSSIFSYRIFYIMSESMEPQIDTNQMVLGKYMAQDEELEIGGIYAYRRDGIWEEEIVIHRLIKKKKMVSIDLKGIIIICQTLKLLKIRTSDIKSSFIRRGCCKIDD